MRADLTGFVDFGRLDILVLALSASDTLVRLKATNHNMLDRVQPSFWPWI